jgi:hypothetical protein
MQAFCMSFSPLIAQDAIQWNREVFARNNT